MAPKGVPHLSSVPHAVYTAHLAREESAHRAPQFLTLRATGKEKFQEQFRGGISIHLTHHTWRNIAMQYSTAYLQHVPTLDTTLHRSCENVRSGRSRYSGRSRPLSDIPCSFGIHVSVIQLTCNRRRRRSDFFRQFLSLRNWLAGAAVS